MSKDYSPKFDAPVYRLEDYFAYKIDLLIALSKKLGWTWDKSRSKKFFTKMLEINSVYLQWLENIKYYHDQTMNNVECQLKLETWEWALLIAKLCQTLSLNPKDLKWQDNDCFLKQDNVTLIKLLRGKTWQNHLT